MTLQRELFFLGPVLVELQKMNEGLHPGPRDDVVMNLTNGRSVTFDPKIRLALAQLVERLEK